MTARAGRVLAGLACPGDVLALWGDLGAGKTTLARGFIGALVPSEEAIPSPTFTLVQTYPAQIGERPVEIWHFDLYRLKSAEEAYEMGIEEAFAEGISLIEWPERLGSLLPRHRLDVTLLAGSTGESRILNLAGSDAWQRRLSGFKTALLGE
ncbi:MAG: tRNA (adenosine(37)-N6)-threonylcarbamoyltransferase complex ATPase subunit type 1 TsaE [Proteobacteria bacterium]|nr:tRNA (adenosine(37)-N6)-threonylcarbamoyltransferase complex ATPase subunit type 1 TsaE [Pseudomonadota bacterium]